MSFGHFEGEVVTTWLQEPNEPHRDMRLEQDFAYIDPAGVRWDAPSGSIVNGASIPGVAWSAVGPPYVGNYRRASVVHDVACEKQTRTSREAHLMFYNAMRADGVGCIKANVMYQAVKRFGPEWGGPVMFRATAPMSHVEFAQIESAVEAAVVELGTDATVEQIDSRVEELLHQ